MPNWSKSSNKTLVLDSSENENFHILKRKQSKSKRSKSKKEKKQFDNEIFQTRVWEYGKIIENILGEGEDMFGDIGVGGGWNRGRWVLGLLVLMVLLLLLKCLLCLFEPLLLQVRNHCLLYFFFLHYLSLRRKKVAVCEVFQFIHFRAWLRNSGF